MPCVPHLLTSAYFPSLFFSFLPGELGHLYTLGHGRELDFNLALKYLQRGAEALDRYAPALLNTLSFSGQIKNK